MTSSVGELRLARGFQRVSSQPRNCSSEDPPDFSIVLFLGFVLTSPPASVGKQDSLGFSFVLGWISGLDLDTSESQFCLAGSLGVAMVHFNPSSEGFKKSPAPGRK